jgi:hypothetical protein
MTRRPVQPGGRLEVGWETVPSDWDVVVARAVVDVLDAGTFAVDDVETVAFDVEVRRVVVVLTGIVDGVAVLGGDVRRGAVCSVTGTTPRGAGTTSGRTST